MPPSIQTQHLRKVFNHDKVAVADLSLTVEPGEVFGFLGPNGAGKTTSVKMLLGLIKPTAGQGSLLGAPLGTDTARAKVGFLPEHFRFHEWLTAAEFLKLHGELYQMEANRLHKRIPTLLDLVALTSHANQKLKTFSKGMLQRVGLAQALLNEPDLIILDEPTSGLDPVGRRLVRDIIKDLKAAGTTVFLNSHFLSEVEVTCDRVAFIKAGRVVRTSRLDDLMDGEIQLEIRATGLTPEIIAGLSQWGLKIQPTAAGVNLVLNDEAALPQINRYLVANQAAVYALSPKKISLEDLFIQIMDTENDGLDREKLSKTTSNLV